MYKVLNSENAVIYLLLESLSLNIPNRNKVRMRRIHVHSLFIQFFGLLKTLAPRQIITSCIVFLRPIGGRNQKYDHIVSIISHFDNSPTILVEDCLSLFFGDISTRIHYASIVEYNGWCSREP